MRQNEAKLNTQQDSPYDDSDNDPDFDPLNPDPTSKRKSPPHYFKEIDFNPDKGKKTNKIPYNKDKDTTQIVRYVYY